MGNLFYELTESDLILAFSAFGPIQKLDMPKVPPPITKWQTFISLRSSLAVRHLW